MKIYKRYFSFFLCILLSIAKLSFATPTNPVNGEEYITLTSPQPTAAMDKSGKKVEVIEFFMYHCPACNMLEPALSEWVKKQGDNIDFKHIPVFHEGTNEAEARLFLTLEAMQMEDALRSKVFYTWHNERHQLLTNEDNIEWAVKNGIDKEKFLSFYNSTAVLNQLKKLPHIAVDYQVDSTPTIIVDGRYLTSLALVDASNKGIARNILVKATLQVVDALIEKARENRPTNM